jgi:hypothetical protein
VARPTQATLAANGELNYFLSQNSQEGAIASSIEIGFFITCCIPRFVLLMICFNSFSLFETDGEALCH